MNFLMKMEDLINRGLSWLASWVWMSLQKLCPAFLRRGYQSAKMKWEKTREQLKALPQKMMLHWQNLRSQRASNYRSVLQEAFEAARNTFQRYRDSAPILGVLKALCAPFLFLLNWAQGLKPAHFVLLFVFTTASLLSLMGIVIQTKSILKSVEGRSPASAEIGYARPIYYKKNERELSFNNIKVPAYITGIGELRALIIDFSVITTNRGTKLWLEKNEFKMRDHLVHEIEPVEPSFPMTAEGRSVLTGKIRDELNRFLVDNAIEGEIEEVRLIYILAH